MTSPAKPPLNLYQRVKRAAINGTGIHLSRDDAHDLFFGNEAFREVADDSDGWRGMYGHLHGSYAHQAARAKADESEDER